MTDTATAQVDFTHGELLALADVLSRVADGASTGSYAPLREAALFSTRAAFTEARAKVDAAALASMPARRRAAPVNDTECRIDRQELTR